MQIRIQYMSQIKSALGLRNDTLELPPASRVLDVLSALVARHGAVFARLVQTDDGSWQRSLLVCVGNRQVMLEDQTPLAEGDVVTLLTPISGG